MPSQLRGRGVWLRNQPIGHSGQNSKTNNGTTQFNEKARATYRAFRHPYEENNSVGPEDGVIGLLMCRIAGSYSASVIVLW